VVEVVEFGKADVEPQHDLPPVRVEARAEGFEPVAERSVTRRYGGASSFAPLSGFPLRLCVFV
jgi:hypothetical protein